MSHIEKLKLIKAKFQRSKSNNWMHLKPGDEYLYEALNDLIDLFLSETEEKCNSNEQVTALDASSDDGGFPEEPGGNNPPPPDIP